MKEIFEIRWHRRVAMELLIYQVAVDVYKRQATAIAIERFKPAAIINQGTSGGHDKSLNVGDIVLGKRTFNAGNFKTLTRNEKEGSNPFEWLPMDVMAVSYTHLIANLVQAIVTIVIVMLLCLGLRSGLIVAALTPTSIAFTIIGLYYLGYGINQITLAGLIIALGMLVDNAVVMSENIMVLMQEGRSRMDACLESGKTLAVPLLVSSLTTIVAVSYTHLILI